jgi:uncharacterized protein YaiL (DUF2058 family)
MSLSDQVMLMKQSLADVEEHLSKLQAGRKASSAKARASLMSLKKNSHQLRSDITKFTKELPVKSRVKKEQVNVFDAKMEQVEPEQVESEPEPTTKVKPKARAKALKKT